MKNKQINIQLRADVEMERRAIEFLEGKPNKYIIVEALELYRKKYEGMFTGEDAGGNSTAASLMEEEVVPVKKKGNATSLAAKLIDANN